MANDPSLIERVATRIGVDVDVLREAILEEGATYSGNVVTISVRKTAAAPRDHNHAMMSPTQFAVLGYLAAQSSTASTYNSIHHALVNRGYAGSTIDRALRVLDEKGLIRQPSKALYQLTPTGAETWRRNQRHH